jgi:hypothetical protein
MKTVIVSLLTLCGLTIMPSLVAQNTTSIFRNTGIRIGTDAENNANFFSYEVFATVDTDWSWNVYKQIKLNLAIETAIGGLDGEDKTAVYGRIAPVAEIHFAESPISLVFSSGPSVHSEDKWDNYDIGGRFQFTSSAGFRWSFDQAWELGYHFQHTSNADIYDHNPGLDMHIVSVTHIF